MNNLSTHSSPPSFIIDDASICNRYNTICLQSNFFIMRYKTMVCSKLWLDNFNISMISLEFFWSRFPVGSSAKSRRDDKWVTARWLLAVAAHQIIDWEVIPVYRQFPMILQSGQKFLIWFLFIQRRGISIFLRTVGRNQIVKLIN